MWRRHLLALYAIVLLSSCAFMEKTESFNVAEVKFENASYYPVTNIRLRVEKIKSSSSCGQIDSREVCTAGFPSGKYHGDPIIVSWEQEGKTWTTGEITGEMPEEITKDALLTYTVIIGNQGSYNTHFAQ